MGPQNQDNAVELSSNSDIFATGSAESDWRDK